MTTIIDYILDLFRSPDVAQAFINDPDEAMRVAGVPANVTAAQLHAVAATAAPAGMVLGGGDPIVGLQRAVADHHSIASPFSPQTTFAPQRTFAPETNTEFASRNDTDLLSNNDTRLASPQAGESVQQGGVNLDFSDMTFGDRSETNAIGDGAVAVGGDNDGDIVSGDGAVLGNNNDVNNGDVLAGTGSNVNIGDGDIEDNGTTNTGSGDVIQDNEGPVLNDVDASGGGASGGDGDSGLIGIGGGDGGDATGGSGGIVIVDNDTNAVGGDQTTTEVGGDVTGSRGIDNSVDNSVDASVDNSGQDNSVDASVDNSGQDNSVDNSQTDNSVDDSTTVNTDISSNVDAGLF